MVRGKSPDRLAADRRRLIELETIEPEWDGPCIVAATGESLTKEAAALCRGHHVIAVKRAFERLSFAEILYNCDGKWWDLYYGCREFPGERWTIHDPDVSPKLVHAKKYGLHVIEGRFDPAFSTDPTWISFGSKNACNSAFQAIGLALHKLKGPRKRVCLIGLDLDGYYFYGKKNEIAGGRQFGYFIPGFEEAARRLPGGVEIINCSPISVLKCFPKMPLQEALAWP